MNMEKLIIWGTGRLTQKYIQEGVFKEYTIVGFVESEPKTDSFYNKNVYKISDIDGLEYDYLLVCVLDYCDAIYSKCVSNNIDLKKILFASWRAYISFDKEILNIIVSREKLKELFPYIAQDMEKRMVQYKYIYNEQSIYDSKKDYSIIKMQGDFVIAWVPIELIFTNNGNTNNNDAVPFDNRLQQEWENKPIICVEAFRNLYEFFLFGRDLPIKYCRWYLNTINSDNDVSDDANELLIEERYIEFRMMQREINKGMDFFVNNPIELVWNDRGYFNITHGHHIAAFLYYSGMTKIPGLILYSEYEKWKNEKKADSVLEEISKQNRTEFYQPIPNPYFVQLHTYRDEFNKSRIHHLLEYFGNTSFVGVDILDIGANIGYISQMFYRMGANITQIEIDYNHCNLLSKVNEMLYVNADVRMEPFEEFDSNKKYDIAIMLTVFYPYFDNDRDIRDAFIDRLNNNVNKMLIWESGDRPNEEKEYILKKTKFKNYERIGYTYATRKFREFGIFKTM